MNDEHLLDAFADMPVRVGMDGWSATVPGGYRPLASMGILGGTLLFVLTFSVAALASSVAAIVLVLPLVLIGAYGALMHAWRSAQSTHIAVRHGHLLLQRRLLGRDRGEPLRAHLSDLEPVDIVGVKGLKTMTVGALTVPVHAAPGDLDQLSALLNESRRLAMDETTPEAVPAALRAMLAAQRS